MTWVAIIPLLPAVSFLVLALLPGPLRNGFRMLSVFAMAGALALSLTAFGMLWTDTVPVAETPAAEASQVEETSVAEAPEAEEAEEAEAHAPEAVPVASATIATIGGMPLAMGFELDPIGACMLVVITVVGFCVQIYSLGYMHRDGRVGWYYAVLSLFTAAMLALVLADSLLLLYMSWEVMGLCSYLLIGFWHELDAPRRASQKAFLTTRVGDLGFAIALAVIYAQVGTFDLTEVLGASATWAPGVATTVALCLLFGAMGKSAQVPLHVWLPDAMAGPTPASALIHAATMVAAGVYLVARTLPIFEVSGVALTVTLVVGATTALLGGLMAAVQHDIKKVLAYSTISQLGYMFIALGAGGATAGMYHLITHAFFKSLLFLGAGVIIHAAHTQDMREMGGLAGNLKWTSITFGAGALALAGVAPFSGFWSKDEILTVLLHEHHYVVFGIALLSAFVTAFYVARLWFRVFTGPAQTEDLHEGHKSMLLPMALLASITAVIGFSGPALGEFLGHEIPWPALGTAGISTATALAGLMTGWWFYGRRTTVVNTRRLKMRLGKAYAVVENKFYFDITYDGLIIKPFMNAAAMLAVFDLRRIDGVVNGAAALWVKTADGSWKFDSSIIDGAVNGLAKIARSVGQWLRGLQSGRVQSYQRLIALALVLIMLYVVVRGA